MTKKLSKKLISIVLSLLMVLSLIPMGSMTAFAVTDGNCYFCGHSLEAHKTTGDTAIVGDTQVINSCSSCSEQAECVGKTWALALEGDNNPMNNPTPHLCSNTTATHYMITTNGSYFKCKQYTFDSTREKWFVFGSLKSIYNTKFPEGATANDGKFYVESGGGYIECTCDSVDFTAEHYYCDFCNAEGSISNIRDDVVIHIMEVHELDMMTAYGCALECGAYGAMCGDPECPNTSSGPDTSSWPTSYVHDDCQHSGVVHFYATGVRYGNNNGDVEGRMFYDSTSYDDMYDGSSMTTLASAFETNGAEIEGWYYWDGGFYPCSAPAGPQKMGETNTYWKLEDGVLTISGTGATPDYSYQNPVPWADKKDDITSVVIENGVTTIGNYFVSGCSKVASVTIPNSVTTIGEAAFMNCKALASITLPNNLTTIGTNAFNVAGLTSVSIPNTVTSIGNGAFSFCENLTSVTLPTGITTIASYTFSRCGSLTSITIPDGVTSIGGSAFSLCGNLASVTFPSGLTTIGTYAFEECVKLENVTLPEGVTSIGASAFTYCSGLTNVTIPSTVTTIGGAAFRGCSNLTEITLPSSVTKIDTNAFRQCSKLASVVVNATTVPTLGDYVFKDCASDLVIYVPEESVTDYKTNWADYEDRIEAIPTAGTLCPDFSVYHDNFYGHVYVAEFKEEGTALVAFYDPQSDDPTRLVLGNAGRTSISGERYGNVDEENTWYHYNEATDKYDKCSAQGEGSHPAFHKGYVFNYNGTQWLYGGSIPVYEGDKVYTAIGDNGNECYGYNDGEKLEYGVGFTSVIVKIDGNTIYFCSDHTGDYGTFCDKCTPPCGACTVCGHPWAKHDPVGDCCSLCPVGDGCFDEILGEQCVLDAGHDGNHDSWFTVTDTDEINAILTKVVGEFKDVDYPDDYSVKISGNATDGFSYVYNDEGTNYNAVFVRAKQKGTEYFIEINYGTATSNYNTGFTFKFDSQGKLTNCYQVTYEDGDISDYYEYPYVHVHTWDNGTCTLDGTTCSHTGMTTSDATCGTCGITNPNYVPPHTHNSSAYGTSATQHWTKCTDDNDNNGTPVNHTWSNGQCSVCNYTCQHTGMTTSDATCGNCGIENPDYVPATCGKCLTCGHSASVHEDHACYDCGIRDACFEYGSAKREFCVLDAGHTGACSAVPRINCTTCNGAGKINCTFCQGTGKITCIMCNGIGKNGSTTCMLCGGTKQVDCSICDGEKTKTCTTCNGTGKIEPHTHNSSAYGSNATQHWTKCTDDNDNNGTPVNHTWSNGQCSVCNYTCQHTGMTTSDATCGNCGIENPDYVPVPCGLCAECGHPQGSHIEIDDWCNDCKFGDGGKCNGEILFEPCVLDKGHTGGHTAWTTITDNDEINTLLAKLVGSYKYKYSQNGNTLTIYGDSTNGYKFAYYSNGTETDLTLSVVQQKGNHYYIGFGNIGFTFIFDEEDNLSEIYKAWVKNDGTVNKYYDSEYIYSGPAVCGLCAACGHDKSKHDTRFCEGCNYADGGACEYSDNYVACVLDKGHTGNHSDGTPEWADTIVAKVDASADKLVDENGTPFANMLMGGKFADTFIQYQSVEYDNDGSVYTIKGIGNNSVGEYIITLDSNGDVASLVTNYYSGGTLLFSNTYTPVPPHTCTLAKKSGQAATCTKDGWKAYYQCKDTSCGKIYATNDATGTAYDTLDAWKASNAGKIAKTGHSYTTKASTQKATDATCTKAATYYVQCDNCTKVSTTKTVAVGKANGHSYTTKVSTKLATAATCTKAATYYVQCDNCTKVSTTKTVSVGKANGHSYTTKASTKLATAATCTKAATYYVQCDNCTAVSTTKTVSVGKANGHSYTTKASTKLATAATCTKAATYYAQCDNCTAVSTTKKVSVGEALGHKYTSAVTTPATYTAEGVRTYTCSNCGRQYTKAIARLKITSTVRYNNSTMLDAGLKATTSTNGITVTWGKVADADGYMVYACYCGNQAPKLIKTIKGASTSSYTFSKLDGKALDLSKNFKTYVIAYKTVDGEKVAFGQTITAHIVGIKSKTYTNPIKVTVAKSNVTLSVNKTSTIKATVTYKTPSRKCLSDAHAAEKRYRSSDKKVATVDANGKITAVGKGTCTIYVFAKNGTSAKVTVTVK